MSMTLEEENMKLKHLVGQLGVALLIMKQRRGIDVADAETVLDAIDGYYNFFVNGELK
jgi:hypothetical protein